MGQFRIYCAGPLFNPIERDEMGQIAEALDSSGYSVFLPQRDGLEFAQILPQLLSRGISECESKYILNNAIFSLDVFQVMSCDGLILNMNGRVPDEGAMVEAGIAWSHDKPIVIFRSDVRSLVEGSCNPLIMGLSDFASVSDYQDISTAFDDKFSGMLPGLTEHSSFDASLRKGERISEYLIKRRNEEDITELLVKLFGEPSCPNTQS